MGGAKIDRGFSLYLDLVRLGAAILVLLHHYSMRSEFSGGFLWQFRGFGGPAVIIFFVLSGFVIALVSTRPGYGPGQFAADRIARILSVAVPAVLLTFVLDRIGSALSPDLYAGVSVEPHGPLTQAAAGLLFLNESWFGHIQIGSNQPYWSLPYEVWYYCAFGLALFAPGRWRVLGPVLALVVAGPWIASAFPIWLLGCVTYWYGPRLRMPPWLALTFVLGTLFGGLALGIGWNWAGGTWTDEAGDVTLQCAVAFGIAANFAAAWHIGPLLLRALGRADRLIWLSARMTFTLYLLHLPLMFCLRAVSPWPSASWANRLLVLGGTLLIAAGLTIITDHLQSALRLTLRDWFGRARKPALAEGAASE